MAIAIPELARRGVPEHVSGVVVAVPAQRLSHRWIVLGVSLTAAGRPPVFADTAISAGTAYGAVKGSVYGAE
ncbi:hypothetical protein GCM10010339_71630 [Streptomyces alanosinicus]|uniref:Uncharacterized protein n=1 Tax=Streptomyces alanosinicus TaxID=68171 RepID=A0A918YQQ3_9ACTN|nr:hypothetical protein GCM10010339_71630 [Streptomyces alanosinicus]